MTFIALLAAHASLLAPAVLVDSCAACDAVNRSDLAALRAALSEAPDAVNGVCNAERRGLTPLTLAAFQGKPEMVRALLEMGADPLGPEWQDKTPTDWAALMGHVEVMALLVEASSVVDHKNSRELTPLVFAAKGGSLDAVDYLIGRGANPMSSEAVQRGLLEALAISECSLLRRLTGAGLRLHGTSASRSVKPLPLACKVGDEGVVGALLEFGVPPDQVDQLGLTGLHYSAFRGRVALIEVLLKAGASVGKQTPHGDDALLLAVKGGQLQAAMRLVRLYAAEEEGLPRDSAGWGPLHIAVVLGDLEMVRGLCSTEAFPADRKTQLGRTPLHYAFRTHDSRCVRVLGLGAFSVADSFSLLPEDYGWSHSPLLDALGRLHEPEALTVDSVDEVLPPGPPIVERWTSSGRMTSAGRLSMPGDHLRYALWLDGTVLFEDWRGRLVIGEVPSRFMEVILSELRGLQLLKYASFLSDLSRPADWMMLDLGDAGWLGSIAVDRSDVDLIPGALAAWRIAEEVLFAFLPSDAVAFSEEASKAFLEGYSAERAW